MAKKEVVTDGLMQTSEAPVDLGVPDEVIAQATISLGDIRGAIQIIDVVTKRGAINGEEMQDVGRIRNAFQAFLNANQPPVPPAPEETAE
jgi:hypothetical protein